MVCVDWNPVSLLNREGKKEWDLEYNYVHVAYAPRLYLHDNIDGFLGFSFFIVGGRYQEDDWLLHESQLSCERLFDFWIWFSKLSQ